MSGLMTQYCESYVGSCYEPRQGEMCLAKFSEDGLWYRAACIEPCLTSCLLVFVDYGNIEDVRMEDIRQITDTFLELPCIAHHAVLKDSEVWITQCLFEDWSSTGPCSQSALNVWKRKFLKNYYPG
ncbi:tudor domain-containing protein 1-like [Macrobrachium nipponense]|uniref:tudor domain-containing protein 1-like n=1 Tax=Macrobrachium nipponense TaxID=159736 RepID=UPI0030C8437E